MCGLLFLVSINRRECFKTKISLGGNYLDDGGVKLSETEQKVFDRIRENGSFNVEMIAEKIGRDKRTAERAIKSL